MEKISFKSKYGNGIDLYDTLKSTAEINAVSDTMEWYISFESKNEYYNLSYFENEDNIRIEVDASSLIREESVNEIYLYWDYVEDELKKELSAKESIEEKCSLIINYMDVFSIMRKMKNQITTKTSNVK